MTTPDSNTLTKICTHCGKEKPATPEFFARQRQGGKYGLRADCKECHSKRERTRNELPSEKAKLRQRARERAARNKAMHRDNPTLCERPDVLKQCYTCKQEYPSTTKFFHRNGSDPDGLSSVCKQCIKAHHREYYRRPEVKRQMKEYQQRPDVADKIRAIHNNRRNAPGSFTAADVEEIRKAQGNRCYICHKKLKKFHVDHFIPIALGGTNDPGNLRLACPRCNFSKNKKHPHALGILI